MRCIAKKANSLGGWSVEHRDIIFALLVTATMRVWLAFWGALVIVMNSAPIMPNPPTMYHGLARIPDEGFGLLLAPWQRWDAIWYLRIAQFGYAPNDASSSFFPLFSVLTRTLTFLIPEYILAGLIISTGASFLAFLFLYRLCTDLTDPATARRAVIYCALFPTAFFLFAPYAESLLVAGASASVYFARREQWRLAAFAGAVATLARPVGFFIALPLAIEAWRAGRRRTSGIVAVSSVVGAMVLWMLYLKIQFNDAFLWVHAEDAWERIFVIPGQTILWTFQEIVSGQGAVANNLVDLSLTCVVFAAIIATWKKLPLSISAYALMMIAVPLLSYAQAAGYTLAPMAAAGRRALVVFPAFIALAVIWRGKWKEPLWIAISATAQVILFSVFVHWLWVD
jgi:hypothetical protein